MARLSFQPTPPTGFASTLLKRWGPTLGIWGVGAGTAALFLLSVTPVVKKGLLVNVPMVRSDPSYSGSSRSLLNFQSLILVHGRNCSLEITMRTKRLLRTNHFELLTGIDIPGFGIPVFF
ncbi:hypothetical protein AZE42_04811 [Rhizopogon vesiculosus]|uniref:Uncharacterized protein n=1 Tax=Rhizopogon vesiculosus TaxID=180088 RepID=A0A1J8R0J4_9AGAM|nr:hypothetical protein AZE42_04811 [Rhizopogon vesiculosus]